MSKTSRAAQLQGWEFAGKVWEEQLGPLKVQLHQEGTKSQEGAPSCPRLRVARSGCPLPASAALQSFAFHGKCARRINLALELSRNIQSFAGICHWDVHTSPEHFPVPAAHSQFQTPHCLVPVSHSQFQTPHFQIPRAYFQFQTYFPIPTAQTQLQTLHFPVPSLIPSSKSPIFQFQVSVPLLNSPFSSSIYHLQFQILHFMVPASIPSSKLSIFQFQQLIPISNSPFPSFSPSFPVLNSPFPSFSPSFPVPNSPFSCYKSHSHFKHLIFQCQTHFPIPASQTQFQTPHFPIPASHSHSKIPISQFQVSFPLLNSPWMPPSPGIRAPLPPKKWGKMMENKNFKKGKRR